MQQYYNDYTNGTSTLKDFLESMGFDKVEDSERYLEYSYIDDGIDINVVMDFDPYMHIDESDDDINYDTPVYLYIQDWQHMSSWEVVPEPEYATSLEHLKSILKDKMGDTEEDNEQLDELKDLWHEITMIHS